MSASERTARTKKQKSGNVGRAGDGLRRLAESIPVGVVQLEDGRITWANPRMVEMSGRGADDALRGLRLEDLLADAGGGLPEPVGTRAVECELRRPDGDRRTVICRCAWPAGDTWVIEDVTHVRTLERELLRASQDLQRANRERVSLRERMRSEGAEREEFLTIVSHELRTPVTVISGYNRLLLSEEVGPLTEDQQRFLRESAKACQRLNDFIGNLLEAARESLEDNVLELSHAPLAPVIEDVVELLQPLLAEHDMRVKVAIGPGAERARFDRLRVERVLANLVGNAVKFGAAGGTIEIGTRVLAEPAGFVEVSVSDDGPGVPREDRERIFEPYVRAGEASRAGGLGLGLSICRRLVQAHGGEIAMREARGGGSCFAFTLPAEEAPR